MSTHIKRICCLLPQQTKNRSVLRNEYKCLTVKMRHFYMTYLNRVYDDLRLFKIVMPYKTLAFPDILWHFLRWLLTWLFSNVFYGTLYCNIFFSTGHHEMTLFIPSSNDRSKKFMTVYERLCNAIGKTNYAIPPFNFSVTL